MKKISDGLAPARKALASQESTGAPDAAIRVRGLRAKVASDFALNIAALDIEAGACCCIVGHNGSGKTSLLECLAGLRAVEGELTVLGRTPAAYNARPALRRELGLQPQRNHFPGDVTVGQIVALHGSLYRKVDAGIAKALAIGELTSRLYGRLSRGQTQRVDLIRGLRPPPAPARSRRAEHRP